MNFCMITTFFDIGRENWPPEPFSHLNGRTNEKYFQSFKLLCEMKMNLIVFIDARHINVVKDYLRPENYFTLFISIDEEFMNTHIRSWKYLEIEDLIMKSDTFKETIGNRNIFPETKYPKYTCINHAKVDFIEFCIVKGIFPADFYGWIDFGYTLSEDNLTPNREFNPIAEFLEDKEHIFYLTIKQLDELDKDPFYVLQNAPENVSGGFFFGHKDALLKYVEKYHETLTYLHSIGVADDDQAIVSAIHFRHPGTFCFVFNDNPKRWKRAFELLNS